MQTSEVTFKGSCPRCGKAKALRTKVRIVGKFLQLSPARCYGCGFHVRACVVADHVTRGSSEVISAA